MSKPGSKKRRRANGEGTIERLPDGKYRAVARIGGKKVAGSVAPTRQQAAINLRRKLLENARSEERQSFTTFARAYLERRNLEPNTRETYEAWIRVCLEQDPLGQIRIAEVQERHLADWYARQTQAKTTLKKRVGFLHQILGAAGNPARLRGVKTPRHQRRPLDPESAGRVVELALASADPVVRLGAMLTLGLGLRRSEALGLMHQDRERDGIRLARVALQLKNNTILVRDRGKTDDALAWIPLPDALQDAIGSGEGFVISEDGGKSPMLPRRFTAAIKALCLDAGAGNVPHVGAHALRRTFGFTLLERGVDVVTAAELMRHDPAMLLQEYSRTREDLKREAMKRGILEPSPTDKATKRAS